MNCQQFLAGYSDYLDELLPTIESARWRRHADECARCGRYDRVVRAGLERVREIPPIEPSADFRHRLQRRLRRVDDGDWPDRRASGGSAAVPVAIAAILAAVAWSPLVRSGAPALSPAAAEPPPSATLPSPSGSPVSGGAGARPDRTPRARPAPSYVDPFESVRSGRIWRAAQPLDPHRFLAATLADPFAPRPGEGFQSAERGWDLSPGPHSPLIVSPPVFRTASGESPHGPAFSH